MRRVYFESTLGTVDFYNINPYVFWKIDGIGHTGGTTTKVKAIGQHGYTRKNYSPDSRTITLYTHVHSKISVDEMDGLRRELHRILNPNITGTFVFETGYKEYVIEAFLSESTYSDKLEYMGGAIETITLDFECPSPYFRDREKTEVIFGYHDSQYMYALKLATRMGLWAYMHEIDNDGDEFSPVEIWLEGGAENPVFTNHATGEFIKVEKYIDPDKYERLYINTDPNNIEVSIVTTDAATGEEIREDAYNYLSTDSTLWKLNPGKNVVTLTSDDEDNNRITLKLYFQKGYLGV